MTLGTRKASARGFTLVEMLVAIVVLAIGLLGIAKLSLGTMQANGSALMRTTANQLIQQIVDDMRANQIQATQNLSYNIALGVNPGAAPSCVTAACTAAQIATFDLALWYQQLTTLLPSGQGSVVVTQGTNPLTGNPEFTAVVTVVWNDAVAVNAFANNAAAPVQTGTLVMETLL